LCAAPSDKGMTAGCGAHSQTVITADGMSLIVMLCNVQ